MAYTSNIPQGNQQIATTQPLIQANFGFIQSDLQVEHQFNGNVSGQAEGTHLKASMPNITDPSSLPAGTNGIYYTNGGQPKFYNSTGATFITFGANNFRAVTGSVSNVSTNPFQILPAGAFMGNVHVFRTSGGGGTGTFFTFWMTGSTLYFFNIGGSSTISLQLSNSSNNLQVISTSSGPYTYKYQVLYTVAP